MPRKRGWTEEEFVVAVRTSTSWAGVLRKLNRKIGGGTLHALKQLAEQLKLDTSHMSGQGWAKGVKARERWWETKKPLSEILVINSTYTSTNHLRKRLIEEGIKEHRCECCGYTEWLGRPIPIQLEHVNGNRTDNRLENLKILCPNCHAQTPTYCGKNVKLRRGGGMAYAVVSKTTVR